MFGWSPRNRSSRVPIHGTIEEFTDEQQPRAMISTGGMIHDDSSFFAKWGIQKVVKKRNQEYGARNR